MSSRQISRVVEQAGVRTAQGMRDQASKYDSTLRSFKDSASASSSSSKQARCFNSAVDSTCAFKGSNNDKLKQAEESLRIVMYLSCWGPN